MYIKRVRSFLFLLAIIIFTAPAAAVDEFQITVTVDNIDVRPSPPEFTLRTFTTFKYSVPPPVAALKQGQTATVHQVRNVGKSQWLQITHNRPDGAKIEGWIYAGKIDAWTKVSRIDNNSSRSIDVPYASVPAMLDFIFPAAHADNNQGPEVIVTDSQDVEGTEAPSFFVIGAMLINVMIFLLSLFIAKKIRDSTLFLIFTGVAVLLIEGVVTETGFWGWLETIL